MSATFAKGLKLLEALCRAREPLGITTLSEQIDMNVSAVQRLLATLVKQGYAQQVKSRKYCATLLTWEIGAQVLIDDVLRRSVHPILRQAAHSTGFTAFFMLNKFPLAMYFDKVEGANGVTYSSEPGVSVPITATASGLAMTAFLDQSSLEALGDLLAPNHHVDRDKLETVLRDVRDRRYATSESGFRKGVNSVAAPVWNNDGVVCGSIALTADETELTVQDFASIGSKVIRWATEATNVLGGVPYPQRFYT